MARLQGEDKPTYILSYPRWVGLGRIGAVILLVGVALAHWVLAWISFVQPLIEAANTSANRLDVLVAQPMRPLISAHLSLLLVAGAVAFLYSFLPDLSLTSEGLAVRTILGWKSIPWTAVSVVRIMAFETRHRRLVLVQGTWARWSPWPRLVSICLGAGTDPGVLVTSDIRDFKPLMRCMYEEVKQASPDALFDDEFLSPSALMVLEPVSTLDTLVDDARGEGWPVAISAQAMSAVPAGLILVQLLVLLLRGGAWWKPLAILGLCEMEWIIGALYLFALAEFFPGKLEFQGGLLLYPLAQIPRALLTVPMAMLVATGVPFLAAMVGLVGVLWAVMLTALLVQRLYRLDSILPAMAGGALQALLQFLALAVVFS